MAKKPKGYYSPEAIQSRQRAEVNAYNAVKEEQQKQQPISPPQSDVKPLQLPVSPKIENLPKPPPYMAYDTTSGGLAYYGDGFKGWLRKAWADLTDPTKFKWQINQLDQDTQSEINAAYDDRIGAWARTLEEKLKWSQRGSFWFGAFTSAEEATGLTAEDVAALPAGLATEKQITKEASKAEGDTRTEAFIQSAGTGMSRAVRLGVDTTQNLIWGGLALLSLDDEAMRKIHTTSMGLDSVADQFKKDEPTNLYLKINQSSPYAIIKDAITVTKAMMQNKITWAETKERIQDYQKASAMAYTLAFDEAKRAEFDKALAEGKDPGFLAQDMGKMGTELLGSILGSPSTYLGMSLVKPINYFDDAARLSADTVRVFGKTVSLPWQTIVRIPTFGEFIGANIGKARLAKASDRFVNNVMPDLDTLLRNSGNVNDERQAAKVVNEAVGKVSKFFDSWKQKDWMWNLASVDRDGKVRRASADADYFLKSMMTRYGLNETLATLQDMANLRKGGSATIDAAKKLLTKSDFVFSDVGMLVGEIMHRMDNDNLLDVVKKSANHQETYGLLYHKLESVIGDLIPSVDEMLQAESKLKAGDTSAKVKRLAEMAKDLPKPVRIINQLTRPSEAVVKKTTGGMVQLFMNWVPRSWARNIYGQSLLLAMSTDLKTAVLTSLEALGRSPVKKYSDNILANMNEALIRKLGFAPIEASLGIADSLQTKTKFGFLPAMQRSEQITAANIILKVVDDELKKALPSVLKGMPEWDNLLNMFPQNQKGLMFSALKRSAGNVDEALDIIRKIAGNGEVETWRLVEPSVDMQNHLKSIGMLDEFYDLQKNAESVDEFKSGLDAIVSRYDALVTEAAQKMPSTVSKMPEELYEFAGDLADTRKVDVRDKNLMAELIQSWQNTQDQLTTVVSETLAKARRIALENPQLYTAVEEATARIEQTASITVEQYRSINLLRDEIIKMIDASKDADAAMLKTMWTKPIYYKGRKFQLSEIYQSQNLAKLQRPTFRKRLWTAFFETSADVYRNGNNKKYTGSLQILEEMATKMGMSFDEIVMADKGSDNPYRVLTKLFQESEDIEDAVSWRRFLRQFDFQEIPKASDGSPILIKDVIGDFQEIFKTWKGGKKHIVNAVAADTGKVIPYEQVTLEDAYKAIWSRTRVPPFDDTVSEARILWETRDEFLADVQRWGDTVTNEWGSKVKSTPVDMTDALRSFRNAFETRMKPVREMAGRVAVETRNFVLHDYDKTYMDHALSYLFGNSFHYWTTRSYAKMLENVVDNPKYANIYLAYKDYIQQEHADMPEYYRQNAVVTNLLGIDLSNPYYINLESMINPVYGLTGSDFNDPKKRVDWVTNMVSDMGRMGPSFSPLVNWALALKLYTTGQQEAGERWLGRLLPQSQLVKSASSTLFGEAIEIDPFVQVANQDLWGGADPYERNRVVAALAMMVQRGDITQEQMIEAARSKNGDIWNAAVNYSAQKRFQGDVSSFFIGVGARPRTQEDMVIEKFWGDYSTLLASKSIMTPDQYRDAWNALRENPEYGMFVDGLLLGRKNSAEMETAYAYNVLGRIPPGQMTDITGLVDIDQKWIEEFYNAKGDISKMNLTEQDKARFIAGIEDMAQMYQMPSNANRQSWAEARKMYAEMKDVMNERYGEDIQDKLEKYYDLSYSDQEDFLDDNPIVRDALILQDYYIISTPTLNEYYGGFSTTERYFTNIMYRDLEQKYGSDMRNLDLEYSDLLDTKERKAFEAQHPGFSAYLAEKKQLLKSIDERMKSVEAYLPEAPSRREDATAQSDYQQALLEAANTPNVLPMEYWTQTLGEPLVEQMADYYQNGDKLSYYARQELQYQARQLGMSYDEVLAYFGASFAQSQGSVVNSP
jgi:hypothetical protein